MKIISLLLAATLTAITPIRAKDTAPVATVVPSDVYEARTFGAPDGALLNYRLLRPKNYDPTQKYPLVLFLHGSGERGSDNSAQLKHGAPVFLKDELREKFPCFVVAPQCPQNQKWADIDWGSDKPVQPNKVSEPTALVLNMVDTLQKEFSIDADRLYVTGLSMGGYGTWDLITRFPEKWAAAVPICGGGDKTTAALAKSLPIWAFHGMLDTSVIPARSKEMIDAITAAGGKPLFSEYPYVKHDSWVTAYGEPELLPWLFAQKRGQAEIQFSSIAPPFAQPPSSQFPGAGPVQSGLWFRELWQDKRKQWFADTTKDQGAVVFFGDSITEAWTSLASDFPNLKVANRGISGDTTRGLLGRIQGDVIDLHPKAVFILIGTNDLDQGAEPTLVLENLQTIVAELHRANPKMPIVISKAMPRGAKPGKFPEKLKEFNTLSETSFRDDPLVTICDSWTPFDDGTGQCRKEEFSDMLHPGPAGYAKWVAALRPIIAKLKL